MKTALGDPLTERQEKVLAYMKSFMVENGRTTTFREICAHFGWNGPNAAVCHMNALVKKGYVKQIGRGTHSDYVPVGAKITVTFE